MGVRATIGLAPRRVAGSAAAPVISLWERLARPAENPAHFDPSRLDDLPVPARRWLGHSMAPGVPLARAVLLEMEGQIRLRGWLPFRAVQVLAPPEGFVWAARARLGPLSIGGYDRYGDGGGQMRWRLAGKIPIMRADGPDIDRSAAGRLAAEAVWAPAVFLGPSVTWPVSADEDTAVAEWTIGRHTLRTNVHIDTDGSLRTVTMSRWGNPNGAPFGEYPFGAGLGEEATFDGVTIPTRTRAGWFYGTERWSEGEFFRARITRAQLL